MGNLYAGIACPILLMMSLTHATIAAAGTALILGTANPLTLSLAILGSQLPDLDTTTSAIGQICYPISRWIEDRYPHRSITHSFLATLAIAVFSLAVGWLLGQVWTAIALPLGHLLACFSDTFTKQGVQLFYPYPAWAVSVSNPRRRLKTGGTGELWVLAGAIVALLIGLYLATGGGLTHQLSQGLGLKEGAFRTYNQQAATHHIYAEIKGVWADDRTVADGRYFIVGVEGSDFVITDGKGLYKTGEQLVTNHLSTSIGAAATTQTLTVNFADEPAIDKLQPLLASYPNALIWVSGSIDVDLPEAIQLPVRPDQFQTAALTGKTLTLRFHPLDQAIGLLREEYAIGTLQVKVVHPKPEI